MIIREQFRGTGTARELSVGYAKSRVRRVWLILLSHKAGISLKKWGFSKTSIFEKPNNINNLIELVTQ